MWRRKELPLRTVRSRVGMPLESWKWIPLRPNLSLRESAVEGEVAAAEEEALMMFGFGRGRQTREAMGDWDKEKKALMASTHT